MDKWHSNSYRYGFEAREGVIAHEFGHGFGLDHVGNECQLMNPIATVQTWNCTAFKPTSGDVDGMRAIYT
jgi:predicted Zn-dependent protease